MKLSMTTRGEATDQIEPLRQHLVKRMGLGLDRQADRVMSLSALLDDLNGPKGGVDKRCRLTARGPEIGEVVVEHVAADWPSAIDVAMDTLSRVVSRQRMRTRRPWRRLNSRILLVENA